MATKTRRTVTLRPIAGDIVHDVLVQAVAMAKWGVACQFKFNDTTFRVSAGESLSSAKARWKKQTGSEVRTREQMAGDARKLEDTKAKQDKAIKEPGVATEQQLRDMDAPWPKSEGELVAFIKSMVDRPHDYGTCVYAMSLAATATMNYVGSALGVSGFQASCADLDIVRRTRGYKHGFRIVDYGKLLFPQYCDDAHTPGWQSILNNEETRNELRKAAKKELAENEHAHPNVIAHWKRIASQESF